MTNYGVTPTDGSSPPLPLGCVYVPNVGLIPLQGYLVFTDGLSNTSALAAMAAEGVYNSSAPTLTNGQSSPLQLDAAGNLLAKIMGIYNTVAPGLANGQSSLLQLDSSGNLQASLNTYLAGEDPTQTANNQSGVMVTEQRFAQLGAIISSNTTTFTKASPGLIHTIFVGDPGSAWVLTIYNALTATGTPVVFKPTASGSIVLNEFYSVGITIVSTGTTPGNVKVIGR